LTNFSLLSRRTGGRLGEDRAPSCPPLSLDFPDR
jgi:hypothetical protein